MSEAWSEETPGASSSWASEEAFARRPGILKIGWLRKEGASTLSRWIPSWRFFILTNQGRLEYYEQLSLRQALHSGGAAADLNDWNLVVFVGIGGQAKQALAVGDVIVAVDGTALGTRSLANVLADRALGRTSTLTILRPKGSVPIFGSHVEQLAALGIKEEKIKRS